MSAPVFDGIFITLKVWLMPPSDCIHSASACPWPSLMSRQAISIITHYVFITLRVAWLNSGGGMGVLLMTLSQQPDRLDKWNRVLNALCTLEARVNKDTFD